MEIFAANLRKRAQQLRLSHAEVARRAGLSEKRFGNYVSGLRQPDLATLLRIATALESSPNELLGFMAEVSDENMDRANQIAGKLGRLTQDARHAILVLLDELGGV